MTNKLLENIDHISKLPHISEDDAIGLKHLYEILSTSTTSNIVIKEEYFHIIGSRVGMLFGAIYNMLDVPVYVEIDNRELAFEDYLSHIESSFN